MAEHNDLGKKGEALAQQYLEQNGYLILEKNWRLGPNEVDIIAYKDHEIVFVEVKTRTTDDFGDPEKFVTPAKQRAYIRMANNYVLRYEREEEVRFDIIAVVVNTAGCSINHLQRAFSQIG